MTEASCATCGMSLPAGFRFCPSCGTAVTGPVDDVRKTVTLLFCDVSGSTALGEQLDPEVLRGLMGQYFAVAREAVERHGGLVEKFVGDAVLAVFGIPVVREDDPLRAVRAAVDMRDELVALSERLERSNGVRLSVRTGVNTGAVVAGADRAGGGFATGDAVNTAARLEQSARPGEVLVGASTYRLVRDAVEVEAVEPLVVKGKTDPLPAYRLLRVLEVDEGRARRPDAPLIGRERERRVLDDAMERVRADARCQLVTVLGPAGIGKTRLVADFEQALNGSVRVLRGRCLSYGRGITFWPIVSVLRQAAGLTGEEPAAEARAALQSLLTEHEDAAAIVDRIAPLLGIDGEPGSLDDTVWAVRSLLEHLADAGPVLVVIDDLQWAEPALLDLLERLRDDVRDVPLLLLCPARPELLEQQPAWGGGAVNATTLMLEPLAAEETGAVLAGLLGPGVPAQVADAVNRWGDGNPLFLEEVATHLVEEGLLVATDDGWTVAGDLAVVSVPPTVTALLGARLDRLPAGERALLEHLSVIGLEAAASELAALFDDADGSQLLTSLSRKGLLRRLRGGSGDVFAFRHVLLREAAYDAVPKSQRAGLHERYADWLADHGTGAGGEVDAFIGHHLEQAARLQRELAPNAPGVVELETRAAEALATAAERARQADNNAAASALFTRGLALLPPGDARRRRWLLQLGWARSAGWQTALAREAVEEGLAEHGDGPPDLVQLALEAAQAVLRLHAGEHLDPRVAVALGERAADAARAADDNGVLCHALDLQIQAYWMAGQCGVVAELCKEVVRIGLPAERVLARHVLLGAIQFGPTPYSQVLAATADEGEVRSPLSLRLHLLIMRAHAHAALDRPAEADEGLAAARRIADESAEALDGPSAGMGVDVAVARGDLVGATAELQNVIQSFRRTGGLAFASTHLAMLAALLAEQGDDAGAAVAVKEAAEVTSPYDAMSVALAAGARAVLAARVGDAAAARSMAEQALAVIDATEFPMVRGELRRWLSEVPARSGDVDGQRKLLREALATYRAKEHLPLARRTEQMLAALD